MDINWINFLGLAALAAAMWKLMRVPQPRPAEAVVRRRERM